MSEFDTIDVNHGQKHHQFIIVTNPSYKLTTNFSFSCQGIKRGEFVMYWKERNKEIIIFICI